MKFSHASVRLPLVHFGAVLTDVQLEIRILITKCPRKVPGWKRLLGYISTRVEIRFFFPPDGTRSFFKPDAIDSPQATRSSEAAEAVMRSDSDFIGQNKSYRVCITLPGIPKRNPPIERRHYLWISAVWIHVARAPSCIVGSENRFG